jgi:hypothetical protein
MAEVPSLSPMLAPGAGPPIGPIVAWRPTAVRLPLNEDCWLGINGVGPARGAAYRSAIQDYVQALNAAGLIVIVDLHWNAPGATPAASQQLMADADHALAFWRSVGVAFRQRPSVVFDLYNEPNLSASRMVPRGDPWKCWLRGCTVRSRLTHGGPEERWRTVGMQALIDTIRSAGAPQPIMLGGLSNASHLVGFPIADLMDHVPGRGRQLIVSFHAYWYGQDGKKCAATSQRACALNVQERRWRRQLRSLIGRIPVVTGELGEFDCAATYVNAYMDWADAHGVSYLAWAWVPAGCAEYPALIRSYDGTPTPFGGGVLTHLRREADSLVTSPTRNVQPWTG